MPHIPPFFASIPKLHCTDTSKPEDTIPSAEPNFPANNGTHLVAPKFTDDPNPFLVAPKFTDDPNPTSVTLKFMDGPNPTPVAPKFTDNLDTYPVDPNFTDKVDSFRDLTTSGYVLNMAPTELNSAVLTLSVLGSSFYDISSQLSLNLGIASQKSIFIPVQIPYEPFSLISDPYSSLTLPEEVDTILFRRWEPSPISLIGTMASKGPMDQGDEVFIPNYKRVNSSENITHLRVAWDGPALTTSPHAK